jgi:hypothetical protein
MARLCPTTRVRLWIALGQFRMSRGGAFAMKPNRRIDSAELVSPSRPAKSVRTAVGGFRSKNLTRAAATLTGPGLAKATTATIRRKLIAIPARIASSARRVTLHLPAHWSWESAWSDLFNRACGPPTAPTT